MKNKYGNYVIFKSLTTGDSEERQLIMQSLIRCVNSVNVTKYRTRWLQFIEENPLKVPNLSPVQTMKPSLFKSGSGQFSESTPDAYGRPTDNSTGEGFEQSWDDLKQQ